MRKSIALLGVPIDDLDNRESLERIEQFIASGSFHQVATANTDFLIKAAHDPELKEILQMADLVVPDGMPLVKASSWLKAPLRERVTGADMVPALASIAAKKGYKLFMLGAKPEVAAAAKARLERENPGLQIVGCVSPPLANLIQMDHESILAEIETARPDVLLVAFGNPKQEKWIYMNRARLQVPVCIGIGGTFDFLAGTISRAPEWVQRSGFEWLYRLSQEPKRLWKRYTGDIYHFARLMSAQLKSMRTRPDVALKLDFVDDAGHREVKLLGSLEVSRLSEFQKLCDDGINSGRHLLIDLTAAEFLDSTVMGTLLNLPKRARFYQREVALFGANTRVLAALKACGVADLVKYAPTREQAMSLLARSSFSVSVATDGQNAELTLCGHANALVLDRLETALKSIPGDSKRISMNLSDVAYIDAGVVRLLSAFATELEAKGAHVQIVQSEAVKAYLQRERFAGVLNGSSGA